MSDSSSFELPSDHEKQTFKFIVDKLRERQNPEVEEIVESAPLEPTSFRPPPLPQEKNYFRIGEVADLVGVEPYVLRYWETEFRLVRPTKAGSGHRVYGRRDVEALQWIRHLLHVEKFSIKGAKKKLQEMRQTAPTPEHPKSISTRPNFLKELAHDLKQLIQSARGNPGVAPKSTD